MNNRKLEFGLQPPEGATVAWGARAIYLLRGRVASIDLVPDRKSVIGDGDERDALYLALDNLLLPALRKECEKRRLEGSSRDLIEIRDAGYVLRASPNASCGYLYIGAWPEKE